MTNESRAEEILNSLEGLSRASMPPGLRERILSGIPAARIRIIKMSPASMVALAAGLALLIGLNLFTITAHPPTAQGNAAVRHVNPLSDDYFAPAPSI